MKKLLIFVLPVLLLVACSQKPKTEEGAATADSTKKPDDTKALYEKNMASLKAGLAAFSSKNLDSWAADIADDVVFNSPVYGDTVRTKAHWKQLLASFTADWDSISFSNPNYLPGVDSVTHEFDGSVRVYGNWIGKHKSGKWTNVAFYGSYDFNKDGKVSSANEFFDVGGLMNAVKGK